MMIFFSLVSVHVSFSLALKSVIVSISNGSSHRAVAGWEADAIHFCY